MVTNSIRIIKMYPESFIANVYSVRPFRMIGLIDVSIQYEDGIERVTLPFYRSSGTNDGKIQGLWYPIVGIKVYSGEFREFTKYLNFVLSRCTKNGKAKRGWLAKSLFFIDHGDKNPSVRGFSSGKHYENLLDIGKNLRILYKNDRFQKKDVLDAENLNYIVTSNVIYDGNRHTQRKNFERLIEDIFNEN